MKETHERRVLSESTRLQRAFADGLAACRAVYPKTPGRAPERLHRGGYDPYYYRAIPAYTKNNKISSDILHFCCIVVRPKNGFHEGHATP